MNIAIYEANDDELLSGEDLKTQVHCLMKKDRDILDKASNAFVGFVRYYKEHNLKFIF